jgi:aminoglycoside phosphotransferase (APT) family kinase protein
MATIGDPLMDLGTTLAYWVDPDDPAGLQAMAFGLTTLPGNLNRRQLVQRYAEGSGRDVAHVLFYFVYGLFKVVVIAQQIYARYKGGFSQDERFAMMIVAVRILGQTAAPGDNYAFFRVFRVFVVPNPGVLVVQKPPEIWLESVGFF